MLLLTRLVVSQLGMPPSFSFMKAQLCVSDVTCGCAAPKILQEILQENSQSELCAVLKVRISSCLPMQIRSLVSQFGGAASLKKADDGI